jgi:single-stranded DNA-specific DHH superfamily exonuclease
MKKHDVSYHDHDDSISFHFDHCIHVEASEYSFSNQSTKKKISFSKRNFFDQSEIIENKKTKIFLEKTNNSKMILKRVERNERLNESRKRLIEHRMNES